MNETTCICPFVKSRVSAGTRKRRSKKGDLSCRIDCYSYMARFGTKHAGQAISRAYGKSNSLFLVKFCYILPACLTKNRLYTFKIVHLNAVITLSNSKQNKYSNSIYKIYLKPCHDHCILPTYFQNNKKTHNDLALASSAGNSNGKKPDQNRSKIAIFSLHTHQNIKFCLEFRNFASILVRFFAI